MKALDYLHRMKQLNEEMGCEAININEAIEELEELQNRSCENCKYTDDEYFDLFCINPDVINQHNHLFGDGQSMYDNFKVSANFGCNKWESK